MKRDAMLADGSQNGIGLKTAVPLQSSPFYSKHMSEIARGGRPLKYMEAFNKQAFKLCLLGAVDQELADFFEVSEWTINRWKKEFPRFSQSLKRGKKMADADVAYKLYQRAIGFSHGDTDIKVIRNKIVKTRLVKHYPPDTVAAIFWLKNRSTNNWRDKSHVEIDYNKLSDEQLTFIVDELKQSANEHPGRHQ